MLTQVDRLVQKQTCYGLQKRKVVNVKVPFVLAELDDEQFIQVKLFFQKELVAIGCDLIALRLIADNAQFGWRVVGACRRF